MTDLEKVLFAAERGYWPMTLEDIMHRELQRAQKLFPTPPHPCQR